MIETRIGNALIKTSLIETKELYTPALEYTPNIRVPAGVEISQFRCHVEDYHV
ncbi:MAG: hypothetical protein RIS60_1748 [Pseudomonadota bacterium]